MLVLLLILLLLLVFLLVLLLLLLLFFEFLEEFFHEVAVFLGVFVVGLDFEGFSVVLDGVFPIGLFRLGVLCGLAFPDEGVCEVVGRFRAQPLVLGEQGIGEIFHGGFEVARFVGRGAGIELEFARAGPGLELFLEFGAGFLEVALAVVVEPRLRLGGGWKRKEQCGGRFCASAAPVAGEKRKREAERGGGERPLEPLDRLAGAEDPGFREFDRFDAFLENLARGFRADREVETACGGGDFRETRPVELGGDRVARFVADEIRAAVFGADRDEGAFRRSDTNRENADPLGLGLLGGRDAIGCQFLAVREDDKGAGVPFRLAKCLAGRGDGGGDVRAALGDDRGVEFAERVDDRVLVEGERGLQECGACECDEADAVAAEQAHEVLGEELCAGKARGGNIRGEHASGGVHRHDDIAALLFCFPLDETEARLGEGKDGEGEGAEEQDRPCGAAERAHRSGELFPQAGCDDFCEQGAAAPVRPCESPGHQRQDAEEPEPLGCAEGQGSRLHIVCESRISSARRASAGTRNHWNRSRYWAVRSTSTLDFSSLSISEKIVRSELVSVARK